MRENETILYGKGVYGTKIWRIWSEGGTINIEANGAFYQEEIAQGLAGRSLQEQVKLRIDARIRSKLDDGFKRNESELGKVITNQLGLARPMLATHLKDVRFKINGDDYIQPKLDGHRCLMHDGKAYSRAGRPIEAIPEIAGSMPVTEYAIDGELYAHGYPLQSISSWAKRRQKDTLRLKYHVYDVMIPDTTFEERHEYLKSLKFNVNFVEIVPTSRIKDVGGITRAFKIYKQDQGYEGAIVRPLSGKYESGKRSKTLIKVKSRFEDEFECIDIIPTKWGWGNLVLKTKEGLPFKTPAPGTLAEKTRQLINKELFVGRFITCEFAEWTKEKIPFHCVAMRWREDL